MTAPETLVELAERLLEDRNARYALCPIDKRSKPICPRCGATTRDMCGIKTSADYQFVETFAAALKARAQAKDSK